MTFQLVGGFRIDPVQLALIGQQAENKFVGVNCGILDQYSSAMGQAGCALLLDCRHLTSRSRADRRTVAGGHLRYARQADAGRHGIWRTPRAVRRRRAPAAALVSRHHGAARRDAGAIQRARDGSAATWSPGAAASSSKRISACSIWRRRCPAASRRACQQLFAASYAGARDLYEIGAPAMEAMMRAMLSAPGVVGARQAGAGFGGCMVALVRDGAVTAFAAHVEADYRRRTGIEPHVYAVNAAATRWPGAREIGQRQPPSAEPTDLLESAEYPH